MFDGFTQEEYERFMEGYEAFKKQERLKELRKEKFFGFFKRFFRNN